jgi:methylphosphotriester-DNA--protein-cysteine methyltransferase
MAPMGSASSFGKRSINDLSTFNRRFRRVMGESPSAYRAREAA